MLRLPRLLAPIAACGALALAAPAVASANDAGSITKADPTGAVSATLAWDSAEFGVANPRLTITRQGAPFSPNVADKCLEGCILVPDDPSSSFPSILKVADLDGDDEPEVLVDTFSGGAHCCLSQLLFSWTGAQYARTTIDWGDVSYDLKDLDGDGNPEIVGNDPVFSGAFTAFAGSAFPPLVLQWRAGKVQDVTRKFPKVVRKDAASRLKDLRKARRGDDIKGILAAYVADEYLLDQGKVGQREVDHQRKLRRVSKGFKRTLLRFLHREGYR